MLVRGEVVAQNLNLFVQALVFVNHVFFRPDDVVHCLEVHYLVGQAGSEVVKKKGSCFTRTRDADDRATNFKRMLRLGK